MPDLDRSKSMRYNKSNTLDLSEAIFSIMPDGRVVKHRDPPPGTPRVGEVLAYVLEKYGCRPPSPSHPKAG